MKSKYQHLKLNYKIWLESDSDQGVLGDGKWLLLKTISETGSLKAALEKLGLSYRKTWNNLQQIEKRLGFALLDSSRGGSDGGGTKLTPEGEKIVWAFDRFHQEFDALIFSAFKSFFDDLESTN